MKPERLPESTTCLGCGVTIQGSKLVCYKCSRRVPKRLLSQWEQDVGYEVRRELHDRVAQILNSRKVG